MVKCWHSIFKPPKKIVNKKNLEIFLKKFFEYTKFPNISHFHSHNCFHLLCTPTKKNMRHQNFLFLLCGAISYWPGYHNHCIYQFNERDLNNLDKCFITFQEYVFTMVLFSINPHSNPVRPLLDTFLSPPVQLSSELLVQWDRGSWTDSL